MVQLIIPFLLSFLTSCNPLGGSQDSSIKGASYAPGLEDQSSFFEWPFSSPTDYVTVGNSILFSDGYAHLKAMDQTDDSNTTGATFSQGQFDGVTFQNGLLRLPSNTDHLEHDASWTPEWPNVQLYWKTNETSGTTLADASGHNNTGTLSGLYALQSLGKLSGSLDFNGVDGQAIVSDYAISTSDDFAISAWIKPRSAGHWRTLFYLTDNNNSISHPASVSGVTSLLWAGLAGNNWFSTTPIKDGTWHHIIAQRKAGIIEVYVNGIKDTNSQADNRSFVFKGIGVNNWAGEYYEGMMDEILLWNTSLSSSQIATIYNKQKDWPELRKGTFNSRIFSSPSQRSEWKTLDWQPALPYLKPLPVSNESRLHYPGLSADSTLADNLVAVWHFDESSLTAGPDNDFKNSKSLDHFAEAVSGVSMVPGQFMNAIKLTGGTSQVTVENAPDLNFGTGDFSLSFWINVDGPLSTPAEYGIFDKTGGYEGQPGWGIEVSTWGAATGTYGLVSYISSQNSWCTACSDITGTMDLNKWYHVVMIRSGTNLSTIINAGTPITTTHAEIARDVDNNQPIRIGGNWNYKLPAKLDEIILWNRALTGIEVKQLYRRGINKVQFQVRNCTDPACLDDIAGNKWTGPDGTISSYFSELNNNSDPLNGSGITLTSPPSLTFTNQIDNSQYFQYRTILETSDQIADCNYGSGPTLCSPEIKSVSIGPDHRPASASIVSKKGFSLKKLEGLSEKLGSSGCTSGVLYNLGVGNVSTSVTWYWWNGSTWAASNGTADQANTASVISSQASSFGSRIRSRLVFLKTHLTSSGSPCSLEKVELSGMGN